MPHAPRHRPSRIVQQILAEAFPPGIGLVKKTRDAEGAYCLDCGAVFNHETEPYWHWTKTVKAHKHGTGAIGGEELAHQIILYGVLKTHKVKRRR